MGKYVSLTFPTTKVLRNINKNGYKILITIISKISAELFNTLKTVY